MILIAHRGNLEGPNVEKENHPDYIDEAISQRFDVEIDLRLIDGSYYLGHDEPQYLVNTEWLLRRSNFLWIHCKNVNALANLDPSYFNFFWHESDTVVLTSQNHLWAHPGKQPIKNSIAVLPEIYNDPIDVCKGVCTDYIYRYKDLVKKII